jgi:hypothetical protein
MTKAAVPTRMRPSVVLGSQPVLPKPFVRAGASRGRRGKALRAWGFLDVEVSSSSSIETAGMAETTLREGRSPARTAEGARHGPRAWVT